jgi:hypothetical protein
MKKAFYSALVILMLGVKVSARPFKVPPPPPSIAATTPASALAPAFWFWLCTGIAR